MKKILIIKLLSIISLFLFSCSNKATEPSSDIKSYIGSWYETGESGLISESDKVFDINADGSITHYTYKDFGGTLTVDSTAAAGDVVSTGAGKFECNFKDSSGNSTKINLDFSSDTEGKYQKGTDGYLNIKKK